MHCQDCLAKLNDYFDQQLEIQEKQEVEIHLKRCTSCQKEYQALTEMLRSLQAIHHEKAPDSLWLSIQKQIPKTPSPSNFWFSRFLHLLRFPIFRPFAWGSAAVVFLISFWLGTQYAKIPQETARSKGRRLKSTLQRYSSSKMSLASKRTDETLYKAIDEYQKTAKRLLLLASQQETHKESRMKWRKVLRQLEQQIELCNKLLQKQPKSEKVRLSILAIYEKKIDLLRDVILEEL